MSTEEEKYKRGLTEIVFDLNVNVEPGEEEDVEIETYDTLDDLIEITREMQAYAQFSSIGKNLNIDTVLFLTEKFIPNNS